MANIRDAAELSGIDGMEYIASAPDGEIFKGLAVHDGTIWAITDKHLYILDKDKFLKQVD